MRRYAITLRGLPLAACLSLFLLYTGCGNRPVAVLEEYQGKTLSAKTLGVHLGRITIYNPDDLKKDIGEGNPEKIFTRHFTSTFPPAVRAAGMIDSVFVDTRWNAGKFSRRELIAGEYDTVRILLPPDGTRLSAGVNRPELVLFLDNVVTRHIAPGGGQWVPGADDKTLPSQAKTPGRLETLADFALWDNIQGKLIAYGRGSGAAPFFMDFDATSAVDWNRAVNDLAENCFRATPYYRLR